MKARLEVFQNESGREGVDFIVKTNSGKYHEIYLQSINLEKDRSVKISNRFRGTKRQPLGGIGIVHERNGARVILNTIQSTGGAS